MKAGERTLRNWLEDIESAAAKIVARTSSLSFDDLVNDAILLDSVILQLQDMGEAARYLVDLFPAYASSIPLPLASMRMMRNRLAHGYFDISMGVVWDTVRGDVPGVLATVRDLIAAEDRR